MKLAFDLDDYPVLSYRLDKARKTDFPRKVQFLGEKKIATTYLTISLCRKRMTISLEQKIFMVGFLLYTLQLTKIIPVFVQLSTTHTHMHRNCRINVISKPDRLHNMTIENQYSI